MNEFPPMTEIEILRTLANEVGFYLDDMATGDPLAINDGHKAITFYLRKWRTLITQEVV